MKQSKTGQLSDALSVCVSLVGALFIYKYGMRLTSYAWLASCVYFLTCFVATRSIAWVSESVWQQRKLYIASIAVVVGLMIVLLATSNPDDNRVDRWSAIHNFLQQLLDGQYPYGAQTHLNGYGSTFPVWQIWHLPFYWLGNIGYSFVVCFLVFVYSLHRAYGRAVAFKAVALLAICPSFWYEVVVISDLMPNMLLICAFVNLFNRAIGNIKGPNRKPEQKPIGERKLLLCAVVCGLFLSTRLIVVIPLFYAMFWTWTRQRLVMRVALIAIPLMVLALSFAPFACWDSQMLFAFEDNPFSLQTRQGDWFDVTALGASVLTMAWIYRDRQYNLLPTTAFTLFGFIAFVFAHRMVASDFTLDFWSGIYDHTYLSMFIPFALTQIAASAYRRLPQTSQ